MLYYTWYFVQREKYFQVLHGLKIFLIEFQEDFFLPESMPFIYLG
jgi:hypothetical protein